MAQQLFKTTITTYLNSIKCNVYLSSCSVAVHSFAVMGVNTALIQATLLAKAKVNLILPAKIAARLDINEGNFKIEALPVSIPEHVAAVQ